MAEAKKKKAPKKRAKKPTGAVGGTLASRVARLSGQVLALGNRVTKVEARVDEHDRAIGQVVSIMRARFGAEGAPKRRTRKKAGT